MPKRIGFIVLTILAFVGAQPAIPGIYYRDDRVLAGHEKGSTFAPIGLVDTPRTSATGFLVDACHVLTVQHMLFDGRTLPTPAPRATFYVGRGDLAVAGGRGFERSVGGAVVAVGGFNEPNYSSDWALLRLDECVGREYGFLLLEPALTSSVLGIENRMELAGFFRTQTSFEQLQLDPHCTVHHLRLGTWLHDCAGLALTSGSPIFVRERNGS